MNCKKGDQISSFYAKLLIYSIVASDAAEKAKPTQPCRKPIPGGSFRPYASQGQLSSLPFLALDRLSCFTVLVQAHPNNAFQRN